ncbi:SusE domain-containing protein [Zhouia amylolytica]|uniref:SusE domain-containing protein n=1 Tax=Zhouia amylolytica TaxID=376730 RepID=UPI0020CE5F3A|nr:SusE domain-containing protein [Zhouia amylolytica]MCQ0111748.1 SusE domain-containing protein [Zhouia amylolytica]
MKKFYHKLFFMISLSALMFSCDNDDYEVTLNPEANTQVSVSSSNVMLSKEDKDQEVLTVSWTEPAFGYDAVAQYNVLFDVSGGDFSEAKKVAAGDDLQSVFTNEALNNIALGLGLIPEETAQMDVRIEIKMSDIESLFSGTQSISVVPYSEKIDPSTTWGIVGSAANDWGATPDLPFYKTGTDGVLVAYVALIDGEIKFRENNDWTLNYGDDGADGTLDEGGTNIAVNAGTYKIELNLNDLTYSIEEYTWGLVGSATPNGWDGPDLALTYDPYTDTWKSIVTLAEGEMKFRQNNDWALNYGDTGVDGILDNGGDNIVVEAGNYFVTVNFNTLEYSIELIDLWGVIGSATPGGWDSDTDMTYDFADDTWKLNVDLTAGEIKFRANDDWALNYGDTGVDGILDEGGDNIAVDAGSYTITLDIENLTYTLRAN